MCVYALPYWRGKNRDELWCFMSVILEMLTDGSVYSFEIFLRCCVSPETVMFWKTWIWTYDLQEEKLTCGSVCELKVCWPRFTVLTMRQLRLENMVWDLRFVNKKSKREMTANARKQTNHNTQEDTVIYECFFLVWTRQKSVQIVNNICKHFAHCFVLSKIESCCCCWSN